MEPTKKKQTFVAEEEKSMENETEEISKEKVHSTYEQISGVYTEIDFNILCMQM